MKTIRTALWIFMIIGVFLFIPRGGSISNIHQARPKIKIGALGPLELSHGEDMEKGAGFAVKEINEAGGVNVDGTSHDIELIVKTTSHPTVGLPDIDTGVTNLQALQDQDDVVASLGLFRTEVTIACMGRMDRPFIGVGSAAPIITPFFWRLFPNASQLTGAILDLYALGLTDLGVRNITIVREDAAWSLAMSNAIKFYLRSYLPTHVGTPIMSFTNDIKLPEGATYATVESALTPINSILDGLNVNAIMTLFSGPAGRHFSQAWATLNLTQMLAGINVEAQSSTHFKETEGTAYGEIYLIMVPPDINLTPKTGPFRQAYLNKFDVPPTYTASFSYDAIYVLKDAIERAGSFDPTALQFALEDTDYVGASYKIKFTSEPNVWTHPLFGYPYGQVTYYDNGSRYVIPGVPTDLIVHDLYSSTTVGVLGTPYPQGHWVQWQRYGTQQTIWGHDPVSTRKITDHVEWPINHTNSGYTPETTTTTKPTTTTTPPTTSVLPKISTSFELLATLVVLAGILIFKRKKR